MCHRPFGQPPGRRVAPPGKLRRVSWSDPPARALHPGIRVSPVQRAMPDHGPLTRVKASVPYAPHDADIHPVRNPMNKTQLQAFEKQLQQQRTALLDQRTRLRGGEVDRSAASAEQFGHVEDSRAQVATEREMEFAMDEHESAAIRTIDLALKRIESGVYGDCMDCGADIPIKRLEASPQALRCIACQEKLELANPTG
jgi:DnaK suppressor protein